MLPQFLSDLSLRDVERLGDYNGVLGLLRIVVALGLFGCSTHNKLTWLNTDHHDVVATNAYLY